MKCPKCNYQIPARAVVTAAARINGKRAARAGASGRPRSDVPRCGCGAMTLTRAQARGRSSEHQPGCEWHPE